MTATMAILSLLAPSPAWAADRDLAMAAVREGRPEDALAPLARMRDLDRAQTHAVEEVLVRWYLAPRRRAMAAARPVRSTVPSPCVGGRGCDCGFAGCHTNYEPDPAFADA